MAKMASIGSSTSISVTSSGPVNVAMPAITTSHALSTGGGLLEGTLLAGTTLGLNSGTSPRHCNTVDNANYFSIEGKLLYVYVCTHVCVCVCVCVVCVLCVCCVCVCVCVHVCVCPFSLLHIYSSYFSLPLFRLVGSRILCQ